ncbi:MAG TPA: hypothetical protein VNA04_05820 [Thermoanaerobaculia bacterium]|nr:hypothetical protein [Thermoanaerobaculia bacterium]
MKLAALALVLLFLGGCRGEPVPRDYQNHPSTITNPPATRSETPGGHGIGDAPPQPSAGVEGTTAPYQPVDPATDTRTTTLADTPPATGT